MIERKNFVYAGALVGMLEKMNRPYQLIDTLQRFLPDFPDKEYFVSLLTQTYARLGNPSGAISLIEEFYSGRDIPSVAEKSLAELYVQTKDYGKAKKVLQEYNEKTGGDYHSYHLLGDVFACLGQDHASRRSWQRALELINNR